MVQSKLLLKFKDVKHYFFDRLDSLNPETYKVKPNSYISTEQVHGSRVVVVNSNKHPYIKNCDGMITKQPLFLSIRTADCLPIFFHDPRKKIVAAIHTGWKGLYLGIIKNAIKKIKKLGCQPKDIIAAMGPHIKVCCYNVTWSRMQIFQERQNHPFSTIGESRKSLCYLDLEKIAVSQMVNLGVLASHIDVLPFCTSCDKGFSSARRDGYSIDRMLSIIGLNI